MFALLILLIVCLFAAFVTTCAYRLGQTKTNNPRAAAFIGFFLSFLPPFALIYLVVLLLKNDVDIV